MKNQTTRYDQCRTKNEIYVQLQHLVKDLLTAIQKQETSLSPTVERSETSDGWATDLNILAELTYGELKDYERPVLLLSEMCRLLVKLGDRTGLKRCLDLSHNICEPESQTRLHMRNTMAGGGQRRPIGRRSVPFPDRDAVVSSAAWGK